MAEVTGTIGNEFVELNNAATEATLRQLLAAVQKMGGLTGKVGSTAAAAGLDPSSIKNANDGLKQTGETGKQNAGIWKTVATAGSETATKMRNLDSAVSPLIGKLIQGTANASDLFGAFERLPGMLGVVATGLRRVAEFQEQNLKTYQEISDAGVNFGGSLTQMRMAAVNTYMTLDQFAGLMKRNSETFAKMGGTANQGAMAFAKMSNELLSSKAGDELRALGYTSEQVNQGMANYIAITGGRNRQEMQNTEKITKGAAEYLTQLDALAEITGKSREEQEKALKEANANAAYESYLQGLDEEGKKKATAAMQNALATGGKAGADLLKSQLLGLPPMTEAAQKLQALGPNVAGGIKQMGDAVNDTSKSMKDVERGRAVAQAGASKDADRLGKGLLSAMSFMSGADAQTAQALQRQDNINKQQGIRTAEDAEKQMQSVKEQQKKRMESEAADAAKTQKSMQELSQTIMSALLPVIKILTPVVNFLSQSLSVVAKQFEKLPGILQLIIAGGLAYLAFRKVKEAQEKAAGMVGGAAGLAGIGKGPLGSATNPMHVIIVGGGGGRRGDLGKNKGGPSGDGKTGGSSGKLGKLAGGLKGGVGGLVGGMALGAASDYAKEHGHEKTSAGLDIASDAASWAGTGAMLGSVIPGLGTAVGGAVGGLAGGAYGLYKNWGTLFGEKKAADGLEVSSPTRVLAGEAGPEVIAPAKHFENLQSQLETLNKQTAEMLKHMKDTADNTRSNISAVKNLAGDLFKF